MFPHIVFRRFERVCVDQTKIDQHSHCYRHRDDDVFRFQITLDDNVRVRLVNSIGYPMRTLGGSFLTESPVHRNFQVLAQSTMRSQEKSVLVLETLYRRIMWGYFNRDLICTSRSNCLSTWLLTNPLSWRPLTFICFSRVKYTQPNLSFAFHSKN